MGPWMKLWRFKELHTKNTKRKYTNYINWPYKPMMKVMKTLSSTLGVHTFGPTSPSNSWRLECFKMDIFGTKNVHFPLCYSSTTGNMSKYWHCFSWDRFFSLWIPSHLWMPLSNLKVNTDTVGNSDFIMIITFIYLPTVLVHAQRTWKGEILST